jgi:hypothetical protein
MKNVFKERITELEGMLFKLMKEKDACNNLNIYRRLVSRMREIEELIEYNKMLLGRCA